MFSRRSFTRVGAGLFAFSPVAAFAEPLSSGSSSGIDLTQLTSVFSTQVGNVSTVIVAVAPWLISMAAAGAVISYLVGAIKGKASGKI